MKYPKLTTFLAVASLSFHSSVFGKNHVRLSEEECQKLEDHLATEKQEDNQQQLTELQNNFSTLQEKYNNLEVSSTAINTALESALILNDLKTELGATATNEEAIALLGTKCKEHGESKNRHPFIPNNGLTPPENGLINGVVDMKDAHNQID